MDDTEINARFLELGIELPAAVGDRRVRAMRRA